MQQQLLGQKLNLEEEALRFGGPWEADLCELNNILDCYSIAPKGHWPVKPSLSASLYKYQAAQEALTLIEKLEPNRYKNLRDYVMVRIDKRLREKFYLLLEE